MNRTLKIVLLAALAILLLLPACTRPAPQTTGVATPTEAMFPFETPDALSTIRTQTAVALTPLPTNTVEVVVATATPATGGEGGDSGQGGDAGGGVAPTATTAPAVNPATIPTVARPQTYTIQKGEFPYCIARRFDLDPSAFLSLNGLGNNSKVSVGAVLKIPSTGNWNTSAYGSRSLRTHPTTYTVAAGETVYSIACKFGDVAPEQILAANNLATAADVKTGATLQIP